jgi:hypothetical protein
VKNSNHTTSARPVNEVAVTPAHIKELAEALKPMSPGEYQHFIQSMEEEENRRLAQLDPHEVQELIGDALFKHLAGLLFLECDHPFGMDGKLTRQGREVALRLMHSAVDDLSKNMDLWLTYRVVDLKMHLEEIPFA